jgi:hypothetical protein
MTARGKAHKLYSEVCKLCNVKIYFMFCVFETCASFQIHFTEMKNIVGSRSYNRDFAEGVHDVLQDSSADSSRPLDKGELRIHFDLMVLPCRWSGVTPRRDLI